MSKDRYPGAPPFKESQAAIFFGRETETEELYQLIRKESLVVLYAKSGLGKSSMLNAGIIPKAREEGAYHPLSIRFYAYEEEKEDRKVPVVAAVERIVSENVDDTFLTKLIKADNSIWRALKERQLSGGHDQGILLLFDQFEELFTYPPQAQLQFRRDLAEALYTPLPQRYWDMLDLYEPEEMPLTPEQLVQLQEPLQLRVVVAIRHDRMHLLGQLSDYLPSISKNWYELRSLNRSSARAAILSPAAASGDFDSPSFTYTDEAVKTILDFLEDEKVNIEGTQLQIICNAIEKKIKRNATEKQDEAQEYPTVGPADMRSLSQIIEDYYEEKIEAISDPAQRSAARNLVEKGLIFDAEERRLSIYQGRIFAEFDLEPATLKQLEKSRLLRAEPSLRGGYTYELSHDTLVPPILKAKKQRQEKEQKQREAEAKRKQAQELAEAKRKQAQEFKRKLRQRWMKRGIFLLSVLVILAIGAVVWVQVINQDLEKAIKDYEKEKKSRIELQREKWNETAAIFRKAGFIEDADKIVEYTQLDTLPEEEEIRASLTTYDEILERARAMDDTRYDEAILVYNAAKRRDPGKEKQVNNLIMEVFGRIANLWREAEDARRDAEEANKQVVREKQKFKEAESEDKQSKKLINGLLRTNVEKTDFEVDHSLSFTPGWNSAERELPERKYLQYSKKFLQQQRYREAEKIIKKGLQYYPKSGDLKRYLPHILFLQGKMESAKEAYLKLKSQPFLQNPPQTFAEVFLSDLAAFEAQGLIPEDLKGEVAEIRRLLEN